MTDRERAEALERAAVALDHPAVKEAVADADMDRVQLLSVRLLSIARMLRKDAECRLARDDGMGMRGEWL